MDRLRVNQSALERTAPGWGALLWIFAGALGVRAVVAAWAVGRVPPAADGAFYHVVAERIAAGHGYTWLWPDGVVTPAAHYPVGYPAALGFLYAIFGAHTAVAFGLNAVIGAVQAPLAAILGVRLGAHVGLRRPRSAGSVAGWIVALLPTFVLYTPALMTEGSVVTFTLAALLLSSKARAARGPALAVWLVGLGICGGLMTLVRPQSILLVPWVGWMATLSGSRLRRVVAPLFVSLVALACVFPWTYRNCQKMEQCVFVSANGGWNLLIGTFEEGQGGWAPIEGERVPSACREVFQEAQKDSCFGSAGRSRILAHPLEWLELVPAKLRVTFDYTGAATEYFRAAGVLGAPARSWWGAIEIITQRAVFGAALMAVVLLGQRGSRYFRIVAGGAALAYMGPYAYVGHVLLALLLVRVGCFFFKGTGSEERLVEEPAFLGALVVFGLTALVHAVFFGAGRYSLPFVGALAPVAGLGCALIRERFSARSAGSAKF